MAPHQEHDDFPSSYISEWNYSSQHKRQKSSNTTYQAPPPPNHEKPSAVYGEATCSAAREYRMEAQDLCQLGEMMLARE